MAGSPQFLGAERDPQEFAQVQRRWPERFVGPGQTGEALQPRRQIAVNAQQGIGGIFSEGTGAAAKVRPPQPQFAQASQDGSAAGAFVLAQESTAAAAERRPFFWAASSRWATACSSA